MVVRYLHTTIDFKLIEGLRFTGANLMKLAVNAVQSLNVKNQLNVNKIVRRSLKELY